MIVRHNFNKFEYNNKVYQVQVDLSVTFTKYFKQTLTSPEEPVMVDESELQEIIEVLDVDGNDLDLTNLPIGLHELIEETCQDVKDVEIPPEEEPYDSRY